MKCFINNVQSILVHNKVVLTNEQLNKINDLYFLTRHWSEGINITSNISEDDYIRENVLDPILALLAIEDLLLGVGGRCGVVDVGCGGGFVGLHWKICRPDKLNLSLIDKSRKKINFCKQAIRVLGLDGSRAFQLNIDEIPSGSLFHPKDHDISVTRATWDEQTARKKCTKLIADNGSIVCFKAGGFEPFDMTITNTQKGLCSVRVAQNGYTYTLLPHGIERHVVIFKNEPPKAIPEPKVHFNT